MTQQDGLRWITEMDALTAEIQQVIPVHELALLIHDYIATPSPRTLQYGTCVRCNRSHNRYTSNLCASCIGVCVVCKTIAFCSEKKFICDGCATNPMRAAQFRSSHIPGIQKWCLYASWHCCRFPSDIHHDWQDSVKRQAAREAEKKAKEASFLMSKDRMTKDEQIAELRAKLYKANAIISQHYFRLGVEQPPAAPYF